MAYCISDTRIPPAVKHVAVLTGRHVDGLCAVYDNEIRLNDTTPGNVIRINGKNKGTNEIEERGETRRKFTAHVFS